MKFIVKISGDHYTKCRDIKELIESGIHIDSNDVGCLGQEFHKEADKIAATKVKVNFLKGDI